MAAVDHEQDAAAALTRLRVSVLAVEQDFLVTSRALRAAIAGLSEAHYAGESEDARMVAGEAIVRVAGILCQTDDETTEAA